MNLSMILFTLVGLILVLIIGTSFIPLNKDQVEGIAFSSAFSITENVADSINFLGNSKYNGTVSYKLPNHKCEISFYDNYVFSNVTVSGFRYGKTDTSYGLFTNFEFFSDTINCEDSSHIVIEKINDEIFVRGENLA